MPEPVSIAAGRLDASRTAEVIVGEGLLDGVADRLATAVSRVMVIHSPSVAFLADTVAASIARSGRSAYRHCVPDAEAAKTPQVAAAAWTALGKAGLTRSDAVVGVGGGAVTDLAGFIAATWLRGVTVVQVPTTLLAMVDAAVGGKTGINTAEGKNLVGAFHLPEVTFCDLATLATLDRADLVSGLAEVAKAGFIADPRIVEILEANPRIGVADRDFPELVTRAIQVKADVVTADLRESLLREVLNYGHTFGHAIELVEGYTWRHGEAVSVGMMYAGQLGRHADRTPADVVRRQRDVLVAMGLPVTYPAGRFDALVEAMRRDKKARGAALRFVVLDALGQPGRLEDPSESLLRRAYDAIGPAD